MSIACVFELSDMLFRVVIEWQARVDVNLRQILIKNVIIPYDRQSYADSLGPVYFDDPFLTK